jgi:Flp pilus assembly protein TadD
MRGARTAGWVGLAASLAALVGCAEYASFDSVEYLRAQFAKQIGTERAVQVEVPFELDAQIDDYLARRLKPSGGEIRRAADITDFVFYDLDLKYALRPTRDAVETFRAREGNCLSFVNLFVGIARANRLNAFYVEVVDAQRWSYSQGTVLSQGHIVAGMNVDGRLRTYDFLPYQSKSYRDFAPIDDVTATAHFFNNLGAEALLDGDLNGATRQIQLASEIAPEFFKALNNLGVCRLRGGDAKGAEAAYRRGLAIEPDDPALLMNLLRLYQQTGRKEAVEPLLEQLDRLRVSNPFFYLFRGQEALSNGDTARALEYMVEALRRESEIPEVHLGLAQVYLAMGDVERARHHLGRALKLDATNATARRLLTMIGP